MIMVTLTISPTPHTSLAPLYKHLFITLPSQQVIVAICCNNPSKLWPTVVQVACLSSRQHTIFTHWHHMTGQSKSLSLLDCPDKIYGNPNKKCLNLAHVAHWHVINTLSLPPSIPLVLRNHLLLYNSKLIPFTTAKTLVILLQYNRWAQLHLHFTT